MKFKKDFLQDQVGDRKSTVDDTITGHFRWTVDHRRIFRHEGRLYETFYSVGATEQQDETPYQNDSLEIECDEVFAVEKTVTVYEKVNQHAG